MKFTKVNKLAKVVDTDMNNSAMSEVRGTGTMRIQNFKKFNNFFVETGFMGSWCLSSI